MKEELEKKTLNFRLGDWDFITNEYAHRGIPTSEVVRMLVSDFVNRRRNLTPTDEITVEVKL